MKRALWIFPVVLLATEACSKADAKSKGAGDKMHAFIVENCETNEKYCQVCAYGGKPKIMAVGDLKDPAFEQDLMELQKILDASKDKGLAAFALFGDMSGGTLKPLPDGDAAIEKLAETKKRLNLSFPMTVLPAVQSEAQKKNYRPFTTSYDVTKSRTVLLAGADNKIVHADVIDPARAVAQYKTLAEKAKAL